MRKYILLALAFCLFIAGIPSVNAATIPIYIHGKQVVPDTPPILQNNRTFVPIRYIAESFGAKVNWNEQLQQVTIDSGNTHIVLRIGDTNISRNGNNMQLDVAPFIRNDRTYVPLRFVSEALGHYVRSLRINGATSSCILVPFLLILVSPIRSTMCVLPLSIVTCCSCSFQFTLAPNDSAMYRIGTNVRLF